MQGYHQHFLSSPQWSFKDATSLCKLSKHKPQKQQKLTPLYFREGAFIGKSHLKQQKSWSLPAKNFTSPFNVILVSCVLSNSGVLPNAMESSTRPRKTSGTTDRSHSSILVMKPVILGCLCVFCDCWTRTWHDCILCQTTHFLPRKMLSSPEAISTKIKKKKNTEQSTSNLQNFSILIRAYAKARLAKPSRD